MFIVLNKDKLISYFISFSVVVILLAIGFICKKSDSKSITQREAEKINNYKTEMVYTKNYVSGSYKK